MGLGKSLLFFSLFSALTAFGATVPKITYLMDLTRNTGYTSLIQHDGKVWAGVELYTVGSAAGAHQVFVVDGDKPDATPVSIKLPHAPQYLYELSNGDVLAVGLSAYGVPPVWQSHHSVISGKNGTYTVKTHDYPNGLATDEIDFPGSIFVRQFAEHNGLWYFTLRGGENGVGVFGKGAPRRLPGKIVLPDQILSVGNHLYVAEQDNVSNLIRIDLATEKSQRLFPDRRDAHFGQMTHLKNWNLIAVAEEKGLLLINPASFTVTKQIALAGSPATVTEFGQCLLLGTEESRELHFYKNSDAGPSLVETWDLSSLGRKFINIRNVVVDTKTSAIYARSTYPCPNCGDSPNSLIRLDDETGSVKAACSK